MMSIRNPYWGESPWSLESMVCATLADEITENSLDALLISNPSLQNDEDRTWIFTEICKLLELRFGIKIHNQKRFHCWVTVQDVANYIVDRFTLY